ncbi:MAG: hypothetical protein AB1640_01505 [bacterium]
MAYTFESLARSADRDLEYVMRRGGTPELEGLVGYDFKGYNLPLITQVLGFRKFKKGFFLDEGQSVEGGEISGYNMVVEQDGLDAAWTAKPSESDPRRHSFFRVYKVRHSELDSLYPAALLLNYSMGSNPLWNPARTLRDYLVQVDPANPNLLLGKAYVALGTLRAFPSFFVLERQNESSYKGGR